MGSMVRFLINMDTGTCMYLPKLQLIHNYDQSTTWLVQTFKIQLFTNIQHCFPALEGKWKVGTNVGDC